MGGAFFALLANLLAAVLLFIGYRLLRKHSASVDHAFTWSRRIAIVALGFLASGVAMVIAATREPGYALTCVGQCGAVSAAIASEVHIVSPNSSRAAVVGRESAQSLAGGRTLFQERGCAGCHRPDATGVGPTLRGLVGSAVQYPGSGTAFADEAYLREAILNPLATVAMGFPPVMPTFAGQLTEEELQALVVYVGSLSVPVQAHR